MGYSHRIWRSVGVFTIFGKATRSLSDANTADDYPLDTVIKCEFAEDHIQDLQKSLFAIGIPQDDPLEHLSISQ
jgi:hypothetical protein